MSRILVVEDEPVIRYELERALKRAGHEVVTVGDVPAAEAADPAGFELVLTDLRLPGPSGDVLLERAGATPVIVMTAHGTVDSAVDAMKRGAADYLTKPFNPDELVLVVDRALTGARLARQNAALKTDVARSWQVAGMVGRCPAMQRVFRLIDKAAPTAANVLVLGESGTGKELVARALHAKSPRKDDPFVPVNCASIPEALIESELFGHERGAFTGAHARQRGLFEAAHGGTIFLDEVGELPQPAQARLLRVIQDGEVRPVGATRARRVDVRVIAATNRDLQAMVADKTYRRDLYYRLKVIEIALPPLRERGDDRRELAHALLAKACDRLGHAPLALAPETLAAIDAYEWPGNVRELENALERAAILHEEGAVLPGDLGLTAAATPQDAGPVEPDGGDVSLDAYFRAFVLRHERDLSETELAKRLGISRKALWEKRQRMGIPRAK